MIDVAFQQVENVGTIIAGIEGLACSSASRCNAAAAGCVQTPAGRRSSATAIRWIVPPMSEDFSTKDASIEIKVPKRAPKCSPARAARPEPSAKEMPAPAVEIPRRSSPPRRTAGRTSRPPAAGASNDAAVAGATRAGDGLNVTFSFAVATPAALFRRADAVWLVFDSAEPMRYEPDPPARLSGHHRRRPACRWTRGRRSASASDRRMPSLTGDSHRARTRPLHSRHQMRRQRRPPPDDDLAGIPDPPCQCHMPLAARAFCSRWSQSRSPAIWIMMSRPTTGSRFHRRGRTLSSCRCSIDTTALAIRPNSDDVTAEVASDKIVWARLAA